MTAGGDARFEAPGRYLVEQYKTREQGTWSATDLISILRNLRRSIPHPRPRAACYRLVTDGRPGRLDSINALLDETRRLPGPSDLTVDTRDLFDRIVVETRSSPESPLHDERELVFHLLSHFEMHFHRGARDLETEIDKRLRPYAPDLGDEREIRQRLVGHLLDRLSQGEVRLTQTDLEELFRSAGLNPDRLFRMAKLPATMARLTRGRLDRLGYAASRDVRELPTWPADKPVLLIAGESGIGKTWQLGRLLHEFGEQAEIATLVLTARIFNDVLERAAQDIWQLGLGETSTKSLVAVNHHLHEAAPGVARPEPIVAVDDVRDSDLARDLVRQDWANSRMRLVMTVPSTIAQQLAMTDSATIYTHKVDRFSVDELDALLKRKGQRWADLPSDLKKLLRQPILAGIFLELPYGSIRGAPASEYEIFEAFWRRISEKGEYGDEGLVAAIARRVLEGRPYPVPRSSWHEIGLNEPQGARRLEGTRWLRIGEDGEIAFAHERLLNWALAKTLVQQLQGQELSVENLTSLLSGSVERHGWNVQARLAYVPMDTLWLLAGSAGTTEAAAEVVARLEQSGKFDSQGSDLYEELLPTLGGRAVPILLHRLGAIASTSPDQYRVVKIGRAFAAVAGQEGVDLTDPVRSLLGSPSPAEQNVGLRAFTAAPITSLLDQVWAIHETRSDSLADTTNDWRHQNYKTSMEALRAGVELSPTWLADRIRAARPGGASVSQLAYLLAGLKHGDAPEIWRQIGEALIQKVPWDRPRSVLNCIARFRDRTKLDFVASRLAYSEDFGSGAALEALAVLDPVSAVNRLVEVEDSQLYLTRNRWLPVLLRGQPELTRQRLRELAEATPRGRALIEILFQERPDEMGETMFRWFFRALERDLRNHCDEGSVRDPVWLSRPLELIGRVLDPELLAIVREKADSDLERLIVKVACSRLNVGGKNRDILRESARRVLTLMGGDGIADLIQAELKSEHFWVRHSGLTCAFIRGNSKNGSRLAELAREAAGAEGAERKEPDPYLEFYQAIRALASLGPDAVLVDAIVRSGMPGVPVDLARLRAHRGRLPRTLTQESRSVLERRPPAEDAALRTALVIAWMSGDPDLVLPVRAVLKKADPDSRIARHASIALRALGDQSEEFVQLAVRLVGSENNTPWGLDALASAGDPGLIRIGEWLQRGNSRRCTKYDDRAIRLLYKSRATRSLSIRLAVDLCMGGGIGLDVPYEIAAEARDPLLREQILAKAFSARSIFPMSTLSAIQGLACFDARRAVEAIELAFQAHPRIENQLCRLLVRLDPTTGGRKLIDAASSVDRASFRRAAGRALRRLETGIASSLVDERLRSTKSDRATTVELASWLPISTITEALGTLADRETAGDVRYAALAALSRQRQEENLRKLISAFSAASINERWALLVAIVEGGDPYLLTEPGDPLWLGQIFSDDVPAVFECYASTVLRKRMRKEE